MPARVLLERVLTQAPIEALVAKANAFLAEEAAKPQIDVGPLRTEIRDRKSKIQHLLELIEEDSNRESCRSLMGRIDEHQAAITDLQKRIAEAERRLPYRRAKKDKKTWHNK